MSEGSNKKSTPALSKDVYEGKSDHEVVLMLEEQTVSQEKAIRDLRESLDRTERENANLLKLQGQVAVVRLVFVGVLVLIGCMVGMSVISWWSPKGTTGIEKELAFFERLLLVLLGILSSAVVALYDSRGNGNGGG
ncbi:hypothetical protein CMK19_00710 [Candidatus Poribacteria bacterium]|nr:hypothetical protein [Candidatus Poribacteria bacterium]